MCNNAGIGGFEKIWEASLKDWQWAMNVNLWGVIHGVRTSRIYSVTKHAVVALSEALYHGLRKIDARIGASVLCPGLIDTQIMFAFRNRPVDLHNAPGELASPREVERAERISNLAQEVGLPPAAVGGIVVEAIRNDQFYILTHDHFDAPIRARMEDILERRMPTPYRFELGD